MEPTVPTCVFIFLSLSRSVDEAKTSYHDETNMLCFINIHINQNPYCIACEYGVRMMKKILIKDT